MDGNTTQEEEEALENRNGKRNKNGNGNGPPDNNESAERGNYSSIRKFFNEDANKDRNVNNINKDRNRISNLWTNHKTCFIVAGLLATCSLTFIIYVSVSHGRSNSENIFNLFDEEKHSVKVITPTISIQGKVFHNDRYEFDGIPFSVPTERWIHSTPLVNLAEFTNGSDFKAFAGSGDVDDRGCWILPRPYNELTENCLTVKISTSAGNGGPLKPVVVHLHGNGRAKIGDQYSADKRMVHVSFNYRAGILDWMSLTGLADRDPAFPKRSGNYGLGDLVTALSWVKINIRSFGGDSDKVLLVGHDQSAANKIAALSASPRSVNLFSALLAFNANQQISFQSAKEGHKNNYETVVKPLICDVHNSISCLLGKDLLKLQSAVPPQTSSLRRHTFVVDGFTFRGDPETSWAKHSQVPFIFVVSSRHGADTRNKNEHSNKNEVDNKRLCQPLILAAYLAKKNIFKNVQTIYIDNSANDVTKNDVSSIDVFNDPKFGETIYNLANEGKIPASSQTASFILKSGKFQEIFC